MMINNIMKLTVFCSMVGVVWKVWGNYVPEELDHQYCTLEGNVPDCHCNFDSVNGAVNDFLAPVLADLTSRSFFRYFRVNLERPCPFWQEEGQCHLEKCSVCACANEEIPKSWLNERIFPDDHLSATTWSSKSSRNVGLGWISPEYGARNENYGLERVKHSNTTTKRIRTHRGKAAASYDDNDSAWIDMWEREDAARRPDGSRSGDIYVNLLENPERFTGYSGTSARRVWKSISEENCFTGSQNDETCTEKRVFYRVMSGLQASISTLLSREYYYPNKTWAENVPLFMRAVGSHQDRLSNLYFAFLFTLRSVVKAGDYLSNYHYDTGNAADDQAVRQLIRTLVGIRVPSEGEGDFGMQLSTTKTIKSTPGMCDDHVMQEVEECRNGFDESRLFQVPDNVKKGVAYWEEVEDKHVLLEQFRSRFKNISRIMDCVSCEKCRVWGKLQILGLGTAIRILLTPEQKLSTNPDYLNRQEVIALVNTLHQLTKSVRFASSVARRLQGNQGTEHDGPHSVSEGETKLDGTIATFGSIQKV